MPRRKANRSITPKSLAFWRYEQVEDALDPNLTPLERGKIVHQISKTPTLWPSGITKPVSLATAYRWMASYRQGGLAALQPKARQDRGQPRRRLDEQVVAEAIRMLSEDPGQSYTFLIKALEAKFCDRKIHIARSTLQRRLAAQPEYERLKRARKHQRRRRRFVAKTAHDLWQTDAKGPVCVRLVSGQELRFHILTILDDATRAVLAALIVLSVNLEAAVRVFRSAALRWGLPNRLYADRASIFDSRAFRSGLAQLGTHRIKTKPCNAEARGKIEAYHRVLVSWFTDRLASQQVIDVAHLQQLLDGIIGELYQPHKHRGLRRSPQEALGGRVSVRSVPPTRLYEAFRQVKLLKAHRKTGEVQIAQTTYLVPDELRGQRLEFLIDPPGQLPPVVIDPLNGRPLSLRRAAIAPDDLDESPTEEPERWAEGPLQAIYDLYRGQRRPLAEPGFGLPEVYALLAELCGRHVPGSDAEAALVQQTYRELGPLARAATETALAAIALELGPGRPIKTYLEALERRVGRPNPPPSGEPEA